MSKTPWIRFFPSDWLAGVAGLTSDEIAVYIVLISLMYEKGAPIKNDASRLSRICGCNADAYAVACAHLIEEGKIVEIEQNLWNLKVEEELSIAVDKARSASKAAQARWSKKDQKKQAVDDNDRMKKQENNQDADAMRSHMRSHNLRICQPEPEPEYNNIYSANDEVISKFNEFWDAYPYKKNRKDAFEVFEKIIKTVSFSEIMQGLEDYKKDKPPKQDWLHASTFLEKERWCDEFTAQNIENDVDEMARIDEIFRKAREVKIG